jgi:protoporphyrinogen oxidase
LEQAALQAGARIHRRAAVRRIATSAGRVQGLVLGSGDSGGLVPSDYVISAVPLPVFCRLMPEDKPAYRRQLESIPFIGVVCAILRLKQPFSRCFWLNVNDRRISFNGIIEYTNLTGSESYDGRSIVYVPYYLEPGLPRYSLSDEALLEEYTAALQVINPRFSRDWIESWRVFRAAHAQPICHTGFSQVVPEFETPWPGCYLIESTQLYPADRVISGTLRLAQDVVWRILDRENLAEASGIRRRGSSEIPS